MTALPNLPFWVRNVVYQARRRAKRRGLDFTLTATDVQALVERAAGKCEVTDIPFEHRRTHAGHARPFAASLDRRDSTRGYTPDNCRLVTVAANAALGEWGDEVLTRVAHGLLRKQFDQRKKKPIGLNLARRPRTPRVIH